MDEPAAVCVLDIQLEGGFAPLFAPKKGERSFPPDPGPGVGMMLRASAQRLFIEPELKGLDARGNPNAKNPAKQEQLCICGIVRRRKTLWKEKKTYRPACSSW